jgi:hypothetical protein
MAKIRCGFATAILLSLAVAAARPCFSAAKPREIKPEELVAEHVKSLGAPEAIAAIRSRSAGGSTHFRFVTGATGNLQGKAQLVSEKGKLGIVLRYGGIEYPGEHFAFDGTDVMVDSIKPGQKSPLGDFLHRYNGIMKNGLLGGALYVGWPLLNIQESKPRMKCKTKKVDDVELYELEYTPQKSMGDVKVKMYFDPATFRHVMTEYRVRYLLNNTQINYVLLEKFEDFKTADGLTLPQKYALEFSFEGSESSLMVHYNINCEQLNHNGTIDPQFYVAQH